MNKKTPNKNPVREVLIMNKKTPNKILIAVILLFFSCALMCARSIDPDVEIRIKGLVNSGDFIIFFVRVNVR